MPTMMLTQLLMLADRLFVCRLAEPPRRANASARRRDTYNGQWYLVASWISMRRCLMTHASSGM